ncbi:MAG: TlpA disulfide reductase family protein, partial [Salinivirgaceae bacterium]
MRLIIGIFLMAFAVSPAFAQDETDVVMVGDKAPRFTVKTIDDKTVCLNNLKGKYVLVNFFATWCKPCIQELPLVEKNIQQRFAEKGLVVVVLGRGHSLKELQLFNERKKFTFHIAADPQRSIYDLYARKFIPRTYLIDPSGKIIYANAGYTKL